MYLKKLVLAVSLLAAAVGGVALPTASRANTVCEAWSSSLLICTTYEFDHSTGLWTTRVSFHPIEATIDP